MEMAIVTAATFVGQALIARIHIGKKIEKLNAADEPGVGMPYHVLEEITNRFTDDQKLGAGAHGSVYVGEYRGETIVVKVFRDLLGLDDAQFEKESLTMARLQHKNIVRMVGYCRETKRKFVPFKGITEIKRRVHCFEYMGNGSLDKCLSDESSGHGWQRRYAIIKGVCKGLEYLHEGLEDPMFHLDLKPQNILLDNKMVPKIKKTWVSRLQGEKVEISEYVPPEYIKESVITNKFDIFSLGIVILKIITGPKRYSRSTEMSSHAFIENVHRNWTSRLLRETHTDELESYCKQVKTCLEIAVSCVEPDQRKRPTIAVIVHELNETETAMSEMSSDSHDHLSTFQFLRCITKNFSEDQIIGRGGSGVVYKGKLPRGGLIAVKKVETVYGTKELSEKSRKLFENEFTLLMGLTHPNIVQLLEYCYEKKHVPLVGGGNFCWQIDTLLCLEFLSKGSLKNHISDAASGFDWPTRYKIIEGISYGLQYLHEQSDVPIIHMDLKPANILLDANIVPKIADFGISRLFDQENTIHTQSRDGTPGYMPPESFQGLITPMWDIFSLGVIIMEIVTGQKGYPYDYNEASCKDYINTELQEWRNMLEREPGNTNLETDCQQIEKCIQIGLKCVNPERTKRPTIRTITNILQGLEECGPFTSANVEWLRWRPSHLVLDKMTLSLLTAGCIIVLALIARIIYQGSALN